MPEMHYDEGEVQISHGESLLFYSKGLVEAQNPAGEVFGLPRLKTLLTSSPDQSSLIDDLLGALADFTGAGWEQEDDVTMLTLERTS
jgi:serine phosphatase RsbU (regulator of sigma subunit)